MQPSLLYVSPVVPSFTANGLAMRAGAVLEALTESFRVSVLVAPVYTSIAKQMPDSLRQLCHTVVQITADRVIHRIPESVFRCRACLSSGLPGSREALSQ